MQQASRKAQAYFSGIWSRDMNALAQPWFLQSLASCGRFSGVPLRDVLKHVGVGAKAREVVFLDTDRGEGCRLPAADFQA